MSYSDLSLCMSRQVRPSTPVPAYKTEDLSQYLSTPVKATVQETAEPTEEVVVEAAEVSTTTLINDQVSDLVEVILDSPCESIPCVYDATNKLEWRQWIMKSKALSKEYKLLIFESWISQLE